MSDRFCSWCRRLLAVTVTSRRRFCDTKCRQSAFRLRKISETLQATSSPLVFAYADPPYPGFSRKLYGKRDVFHRELIASLRTSGYAGWALSTSAKFLGDVLPLCPTEARVCVWVKPIGVSSRTYGLHNTWEPVVVLPGRALRPGVRDWISAQPARRGGTLPGRKPIAFCSWLFRILGMLPGDQLVDLFPGTGIVSRAWEELSRSSLAAASDGKGDSHGLDLASSE